VRAQLNHHFNVILFSTLTFSILMLVMLVS